MSDTGPPDGTGVVGGVTSCGKGLPCGRPRSPLGIVGVVSPTGGCPCGGVIGIDIGIGGRVDGAPSPAGGTAAGTDIDAGAGAPKGIGAPSAGALRTGAPGPLSGSD